MHDGHVHGSCTECDRFVPAFPTSRALEAWGYCLDQQTTPPADAALSAIEAAFAGGDRRPLAMNTLGLFRTEEDDACDFFREREGLGTEAR